MNTSDEAAFQQQRREADERARALYWGELVQLTHETEYIRHYRDHVNAILTWFDVGRAVISVGALGSWVAGLGYPKLWGFVIVASQIAEAVMAKLPLTARQKGLTGFGSALDAMLIDARFEWESMQADEAGGARETARRWHVLMKLRHEAEQKNLPNGLPFKKGLFKLAEQEAAAYLEHDEAA